jgi:hypothetical protein
MNALRRRAPLPWARATVTQSATRTLAGADGTALTSGLLAVRASRPPACYASRTAAVNPPADREEQRRWRLVASAALASRSGRGGARRGWGGARPRP